MSPAQQDMSKSIQQPNFIDSKLRLMIYFFPVIFSISSECEFPLPKFALYLVAI